MYSFVFLVSASYFALPTAPPTTPIHFQFLIQLLTSHAIIWQNLQNHFWRLYRRLSKKKYDFDVCLLFCQNVSKNCFDSFRGKLSKLLTSRYKAAIHHWQFDGVRYRYQGIGGAQVASFTRLIQFGVSRGRTRTMLLAAARRRMATPTLRSRFRFVWHFVLFLWQIVKIFIWQFAATSSF